MPDTITARLSDAISQPELSRMWETERTGAPSASAGEVVFETNGNEVNILFPGSVDPDCRRLKDAFERAVRRYRADVKVEWRERVRRAG